MKKLLFTIAIATLTILISCSSSEQKDDTNKTEKKDDQPKTNVESPNIPDDMKSLVGEWELVKFLRDNNGNHKIDPEEESTATKDQQDYLKLNADGTCEYSLVKVPATYKIEKNENGTKLKMFDPTGPEVVGSLRYILSVTDKELVFDRYGGFEVFKRL